MSEASFFESIQQQFSEQLPFVVYRKPQDNVVKAYLQSDDTLYETKDFSESGFVFSPFNLEDNSSVLIPLEHAKVLTLEVEAAAFEASTEDSSVAITESNAAHIDLIEKGIEAIHQEQFKKVVLSRCAEAPIPETNPLELFKRLLTKYQDAFVYCWFHPRVGLWLGATPETLMKVEGLRLQTMALAGTQAYKGTMDVEWNLKEQEEQQIVTDFIVDKLKSNSNLRMSEPKTVKAGSLLHLRTDITASYRPGDFNLYDVIKALHPTPAVSGLPKNAAIQFIKEHEGYDRDYYTGFLGELNLKASQSRNANRRNVENNAYRAVKKVSNMFVNLRCMQLKDDKALIYVGGGITKDSIPQNEWEETVRKAETMTAVL
ncbi:chorismate-binding protein [Winogradskyella sp. 3972H.M.0a.05]|uniref:chorismate-binding protein n=1 Tax=Winogradskyella sp. 3972H.M.0a.05 TaxID=2950277 RepID=UPI003398BEB6